MDQKRNAGFFYAQEDASYYDATVALAASHYELMHEVLMDLIALRAAELPAGAPFNVLDVGSGSGVATMAVLERFSSARVVALDSSREINAILRRKLVSGFGPEGAGRWEILEIDILDPKLGPVALRDWCRPDTLGSGYAVVITALTLHHFEAEQKACVYRLLHDALAPGGVLVNADFFEIGPPRAKGGPASPLSRHADDVTLRWIERGFDAPGPAEPAAALSADTRQRLKTEWLDHVRREHHLDSIAAQDLMLRRAGFEAVESPFRYWQSAVLWARKRGGPAEQSDRSEQSKPTGVLDLRGGGPSALRLDDGRFALQQWRELVAETARELGPHVQAICPFGFEVSGDSSYLLRALPRLHVYIGFPHEIESRRQEMADAYCDHMLRRLRSSYPAFVERLHGVVMPHRRMALGVGPSRVVYIRTRTCEGSLITDWARYVVISVFAALDGTLREVRDFDQSEAARGYVFQLAIMLHRIFGDEAPLSVSDMAEIEDLARRDPPVIDSLKGERGRRSDATVRERAAYERIVQPELDAIARLLSRPASAHDELVISRVQDFHGEHTIQAKLSKLFLEEITARIVVSYERYS
jgi:SAM-dependent methyltransferase